MKMVNITHILSYSWEWQEVHHARSFRLVGCDSSPFTGSSAHLTTRGTIMHYNYLDTAQLPQSDCWPRFCRQLLSSSWFRFKFFELKFSNFTFLWGRGGISIIKLNNTCLSTYSPFYYTEIIPKLYICLLHSKGSESHALSITLA
jgi:hypothetical protein